MAPISGESLPADGITAGGARTRRDYMASLEAREKDGESHVLFPLCVHTCVHDCMCGGVHECLCACTSRPKVLSGVLLDCFSTLLFEGYLTLDSLAGSLREEPLGGNNKTMSKEEQCVSMSCCFKTHYYEQH